MPIPEGRQPVGPGGAQRPRPVAVRHPKQNHEEQPQHAMVSPRAKVFRVGESQQRETAEPVRHDQPRPLKEEKGTGDQRNPREARKLAGRHPERLAPGGRGFQKAVHVPRAKPVRGNRKVGIDHRRGDPLGTRRAYFEVPRRGVAVARRSQLEDGSHNPKDRDSGSRQEPAQAPLGVAVLAGKGNGELDRERSNRAPAISTP